MNQKVFLILVLIIHPTTQVNITNCKVCDCITDCIGKHACTFTLVTYNSKDGDELVHVNHDQKFGVTKLAHECISELTTVTSVYTYELVIYIWTVLIQWITL